MAAKREGIYITKPKIMGGSVSYNRRIHKCVWKNTIRENIVLYQLAQTKQNHVIFTDMIPVLTMISNSHLDCPKLYLIRRRFIYDYAIKWKHFPRYWPFVRGPVTDEFPSQRPVIRGIDVFFDLHLNKCLSKQSWGWWFETPSCSLWRHCNE